MQELAQRIGDLPSSPKDKTGWPWNTDDSIINKHEYGDKSWPKVSVVTPSYNQAEFLEETIRSVLLQYYPNLEYIIIDGGSTDGSIEIIRKYEPWLAYWVSEKDNGQSEAINKGLKKSTGEIVAWINSDDYYLPGTLRKVSTTFQNNPQVAWLYGDICLCDENSKIFDIVETHGDMNDMLRWFENRGLAQPSVFWRRNVHEGIGYLREDLHFILDYEFFLRLQLQYPNTHLPASLACFRVYPGSKTNTLQEKNIREHMQISKEYWPEIARYAPDGYWKHVKERYGDFLITQSLKQASLCTKYSTLEILRAIWWKPRLLYAQWIWRILIKSLLGLGPKVLKKTK